MLEVFCSYWLLIFLPDDCSRIKFHFQNEISSLSALHPKQRKETIGTHQTCVYLQNSAGLTNSRSAKLCTVLNNRMTLSGVSWQNFHHLLVGKILHVSTSNVCLVRLIYRTLVKILPYSVSSQFEITNYQLLAHSAY